MNLTHRVARLETRKPPVESGARDRMEAKLASIEAHVVASGDASDRPSASPIERTVRRYLRRETAPTDALRDLLAGRWP